jgi:hypothetical protein
MGGSIGVALWVGAVLLSAPEEVVIAGQVILGWSLLVAFVTTFPDTIWDTNGPARARWP